MFQESQQRSSDQAEPVWTYRGYQLRASEFTTAMVHLFRAEVQRANMWRQRHHPQHCADHLVLVHRGTPLPLL
jgi:uncharacterized membrane protein